MIGSWTNEKIVFLKNNYITKGPTYCAEQLSYPKQKIIQKASNLKIRYAANYWTEKEVNFIKEFYKEKGSKYCAIKLNFKRQRVRNKASLLGLKYSPTSQKTKMCSECFRIKLIKDFSPAKQCKLGVQAKCKRCRADWESNRKRTDKNYRILHNLRNRIRIAIKDNRKSKKSRELIGCSIQFLREYLQEKFQDGMSWNNHGKWHIDHIKPCASFDLADPEQQKLCFHYTNLQPLWAKDNLCKGTKLT